jgi:hypothetical protein
MSTSTSATSSAPSPSIGAWAGGPPSVAPPPAKGKKMALPASSSCASGGTCGACGKVGHSHHACPNRPELCRFGVHCSNARCTSTHPPERPTPVPGVCGWGSKCTRPNCTLKHLPAGPVVAAPPSAPLALATTPVWVLVVALGLLVFVRFLARAW